MKNKNHDELDVGKSHFAAPDFARGRPISKTPLFADISNSIAPPKTIASEVKRNRLLITLPSLARQNGQ